MDLRQRDSQNDLCVTLVWLQLLLQSSLGAGTQMACPLVVSTSTASQDAAAGLTPCAWVTQGGGSLGSRFQAPRQCGGPWKHPLLLLCPHPWVSSLFMRHPGGSQDEEFPLPRPRLSNMTLRSQPDSGPRALAHRKTSSHSQASKARRAFPQVSLHDGPSVGNPGQQTVSTRAPQIMQGELRPPLLRHLSTPEEHAHPGCRQIVGSRCCSLKAMGATLGETQVSPCPCSGPVGPLPGERMPLPSGTAAPSFFLLALWEGVQPRKLEPSLTLWTLGSRPVPLSSWESVSLMYNEGWT